MSEYLTQSPDPASTPRAPQTRPAGSRRAMPGYPRSSQGSGVRYPHPGPAAGVLRFDTAPGGSGADHDPITNGREGLFCSSEA